MSHCITVPMAHALGAAGPPDDIHGGTVHISLSLVLFFRHKNTAPDLAFQEEETLCVGGLVASDGFGGQMQKPPLLMRVSRVK